MTYRLSLRAREDIENLYSAGAQRFGLAQADRYFIGLHEALELLAAFPLAARERTNISPPVRVHPYQAHVIVYAVSGPDIQVLRIRHGHEDWASSPLGD